jgi:hypothetical protein
VEVDGKTGAASPAQIGGKVLNTGKNIGSLSTTPVDNTVITPFRLKIKLVYKPAFKLEMVICPVPLATSVTGPLVMPSSI